MAAGDFNGDGQVDLAIVGSSGFVEVLLGSGDGTFGFPIESVIDQSSSLAVADFNRDGILDLVAAGTDGTAVIALGNGDGTFGVPNKVALGVTTNWVTTGDFDGDGKYDIAAAVTEVNDLGAIALLFGQGDGKFRPPRQMGLGADPPIFITNANLNFDDAPDLLVTTSLGNVLILMNSGGTVVTDASSSNPSSFGQAITFTATVTASFSEVGTPTGSVKFFDGPTLLGTVHLDSHSQASFTTSSLTVGRHNIRARYSGDINFNPSAAPTLIQVVH